MLLHNGGFCNGCIRKRCLRNSRKVSYIYLVSQLLYDKKIKVNFLCFWSFSEYHWFSHEGKNRKSKIRFVMQPLQNPLFCSCSTFSKQTKILRYVISIMKKATTCYSIMTIPLKFYLDISYILIFYYLLWPTASKTLVTADNWSNINLRWQTCAKAAFSSSSFGLSWLVRPFPFLKNAASTT